MEYSYNLALERKKLISDWAMFTAHRLQKSLQKKGIGVTHSLEYSILYSLIGSGEDISAARHEFNYYGKMIDMGVGRGQKIESVKGNADAYVLTGKKGRRPKKWFNKTYAGQVAELAVLLQTKYGEQIPAIIREEITQTIKIEM